MPLAIQELTRLRAPIFHWQESYEMSRLEGETILRHLGCGHGGKTVKEETPTGSSNAMMTREQDGVPQKQNHGLLRGFLLL